MLRVCTSGPLLTVQDEGRPGYAHYGVARSGAFDRDAAHRANRLVGNQASAAVLEALLGSCEFQVETETADAALIVAVAGARVPVSVNSRSVGTEVAIALHHGDRLRVGMPTEGLRAYLAVRGGIDVSMVLGSRSYDTLGGVGPRPLGPGDEIVCAQMIDGDPWFEPIPLPSPAIAPTLDLLPGPRLDWLSDPAQSLVATSGWTVDGASDRTGVRLTGPRLDRSGRFEGIELPSEAMIPGAVQVPPNGQPIILGPDCGTTGGYPVIGVVSAASLNVVGQLRPGQSVRFRQTASRPGSIG